MSRKSFGQTDLRKSYGIDLGDAEIGKLEKIESVPVPILKEASPTEKDVPVIRSDRFKKLRPKLVQMRRNWITREIAEKMGREYILMSTLRDTLFFVIFLILMSVISLGAHESESYNLFRTMHDAMLHDNGFDDVNTCSKFWTFLENFFSTSFYWDYWYYPDHQVQPINQKDRNIFYENSLIGVPRLRQLKVRGDSCKIHHYFRQIFANCFGKFTATNEDTAPFGPASDTAWVYENAENLYHSHFWGKFGWYHGGGFYKDLSLYKNETLEIIETLKQNLWVTRGTRIVFLDFTMYNNNLNRFIQTRLAFEFPRSGGVVATAATTICPLLRHTRPTDFLLLACEIMCMGFLIYYTIEEVREMIYFKWKYIRMFWSWIDSTVIILGYVAIGLRVYVELSITAKLTPILEKPEEHANMQVIMRNMILYKIILSWQLFFIYMKIFKYLNFNKSMAQLNKTLSQCRRDMLGFGIMFFVIFMAFAILGYLIFGTEVETFSNFYLAMFTLLRTILGDFDYTEIERANRVLAPIFFLLFIFLVFFVLLNMFLAIINDTYVDVKTELAIAPEEMRMSGFIKRGIYNLLIKMGLKRFVRFEEFKKNEFEMTTTEIKSALKRIGFTDLEIEMFFARFNLDKGAEIKDLNLEELLNTLQGKAAEKSDKPTIIRQGEHVAYDEPMVVIDDFLRQQEQLHKIEDTVLETTRILHKLLEKLEFMDNVRKVKLNEGTQESLAETDKDKSGTKKSRDSKRESKRESRRESRRESKWESRRESRKDRS